MQILSGVDNSVSLVFLASTILLVVLTKELITRFLYSSAGAQIHPENEDTVNEIRLALTSRPFNDQNGDASFPLTGPCPICLENFKYAIQTNCGHVFCAQCFLAYWDHISSLSAPNCPVCRSKLRLLIKRFRPEEITSEDSNERSTFESRIALFNRRFSGNPISLMDQIRDLPVLLRYSWYTLVDTESGISWILRLRLVVLSLFVFFYVVSPLDIFPESVVGVFGLVDDCLVLLIFCIYIAALFRGHLITQA